MSKHTPGPWSVDHQGYADRPPQYRVNQIVREADGDVGFKRMFVQTDYWGETAEADARLVAAAPDLLATLESLFEHCTMVHRYWGSGDNSSSANSAIESARAAIRKATGEE